MISDDVKVKRKQKKKVAKIVSFDDVTGADRSGSVSQATSAWLPSATSSSSSSMTFTSASLPCKMAATKQLDSLGQSVDSSSLSVSTESSERSCDSRADDTQQQPDAEVNVGKPEVGTGNEVVNKRITLADQ